MAWKQTAHKKWMNRTFLGIVLSCVIVLVQGCYDMTEANNLSVMLAMGVDTLPDGDVHVCAELAQPVEKGAQGGASQATVVRSSQGMNLKDAMENLRDDLPRTLYVAHNMFVVFSQSYAKNGLDEAFDYLERDIYYRRNQYFVVTESPVDQFLKATGSPERINARAVEKLMREASRKSQIFRTSQQNVMKEYLGFSGSPVITDVELDDKNNLYIKGLWLTCHGKVTGRLSYPAVTGLMWLSGATRHVSICLPGFSHTGSTAQAVVGLPRTTTRINPVLKDNSINLTIRVRGVGEIRQLPKGTKLDESAIRRLEQSTEDQMKALMQQTTVKLKQQSTDAAGWADTIAVSHPEKWKQIARTWDSKMPSVHMTYDVKVGIIRNGLAIHSPSAVLHRVHPQQD